MSNTLTAMSFARKCLSHSRNIVARCWVEADRPTLKNVSLYLKEAKETRSQMGDMLVRCSVDTKSEMTDRHTRARWTA